MDPNVPLDINNLFADVLKRLRNLETRNLLQATTIQAIVENGTPDVTTEAVARFGDLDGEGLSGAVGVEIGSNLPQPAFRVDNIDGIVNPDLATPFRTYDRTITWADNNIHSIWFSDQGFKVSYKGFYYAGFFRADVGTNFNIWLADSSGGTTAVVPMVGAGAGDLFAEFAWLHTITIGSQIAVAARIQRTSGAGNITAFEPSAFRFVGPEGCTVTGL